MHHNSVSHEENDGEEEDRFMRIKVTQISHQLVKEQSAKSLRLYGKRLTMQEWLEIAISNQVARENKLEQEVKQ